jgi:hypothetical protein
MLKRHRITAAAAVAAVLALAVPVASANAATDPPPPPAQTAYQTGVAAALGGFQAGTAAAQYGWQAGANALKSALGTPGFQLAAIPAFSATGALGPGGLLGSHN